MTTSTLPVGSVTGAAEVSEPSAGPLLEVEDLTVRYAGAADPAVRSATFGIGRGERVALVGESGSGKSTLGMAVAGFLTPAGVEVTAERIAFDGEPVVRPAGSRIPVRTAGISMVFQDAMTSLDPVATVGSQLRTVLGAVERLPRRAATAQAEDWLRRVGLTDTRRVLRARPYELSGGMRQRVMIALALCGRPRLVIADEPTSALDASLARATMELLQELTRDLGTSLLIVSHDIHLCAAYSDRMFVMYHGEIVEQLRSATALADARHPYSTGLLQCVPTLDDARRDTLPTLDEVMAAVATEQPEVQAG
ncbi:ABC transporter ATP-binding protein [Pseudonocardia sp. WMMC193]|uniref:ABC transporter ATP-binding protein n=1 Tax=Pseudonocardia sp. WMMC193 TaxID=2911965 RepID=UPI001F1997B0|nr:ABC transporter ATP-binding protein [Pseudonocardia sp. WMMC193]MCF7550458.1 ABC transporter ATP-binding protein [Pseudonocardia sp. WMMC193]